MKQGDITIQGQAAVLPSAKYLLFSRDISLASGTQVVTGIGFKPSAIIGFCLKNSSNAASFFGIQGAVGGGNGTSIFDARAVAGTYQYGGGIFYVQDTTGAGDNYSGAITSYDSDGFTITWTKNGSPTGTISTNILAFK